MSIYEALGDNFYSVVKKSNFFPVFFGTSLSDMMSKAVMLGKENKEDYIILSNEVMAEAVMPVFDSENVIPFSGKKQAVAFQVIDGGDSGGAA